jgi:hypothetical protein
MARFFRRGKTQVVFAPTVASKSAPTVANITGGTNLSASTNDIAGFSFANSPIDTPDLASPFTSKIPGPDEADDCTINYYLDSVTNPLHTTLTKDAIGYIIIADYKILGTWASGDRVDVWPVQVGSNAKQYSVGDDPALSQVTFTVTDTPVLNTTIA